MSRRVCFDVWRRLRFGLALTTPAPADIEKFAAKGAAPKRKGPGVRADPLPPLDCVRALPHVELVPLRDERSRRCKRAPDGGAIAYMVNPKSQTLHPTPLTLNPEP